MKNRVAVLGGGAAGFFSSIKIAENPNFEVSLLEKSRNFLSKVRISGGGRCNVTHNLMDPIEFSKRYPRGSKELQWALQEFGALETIEWFKSHGVKLKAESDGRMFPVTDSSETIINCLYSQAEKHKVQILGDQEIISIHKNSETDMIDLTWKDGETKSYKYLVIATGSSKRVWTWLEAMGHRIIDPVPSIFTFKFTDHRIQDLSGLAFPQAEVSLPKYKISAIGPVLITHGGLSGPAILRLSAWAARELFACDYNAELKINFLPGCNLQETKKILEEHKIKLNSKGLQNSPFEIPKRYWNSILEYCQISSTKIWNQISSKELMSIAEQLQSATFQIVGKGEFKEEFVTAGGVHRKDVNFSTMESRIVPGIFFAGEVLDVDGITGGFNFQNAWTTAHIAAKTIKSRI
ncbi:NAD(P)/FAD-dependent oxidoreductase [Leptospira sp. GIMC2001]|uniref:NAD(P)/FAD-dependent oxidoreductase n=1 Tax=Leptospira sp. GIMC2001 TaxID=1513297 RepID=UPI00234B81F7|nr:NAD(P)/FAD-dependent oxidoreductase [Leptospira sp. GIMC2001]WCL48941.1 NAD(P)/FAD-dependent oxidoreductase [Leptospira sp. GIMC2001]